MTLAGTFTAQVHTFSGSIAYGNSATHLLPRPARLFSKTLKPRYPSENQTPLAQLKERVFSSHEDSQFNPWHILGFNNEAVPLLEVKKTYAEYKVLIEKNQDATLLLNYLETSMAIITTAIQKELPAKIIFQKRNDNHFFGSYFELNKSDAKKANERINNTLKIQTQNILLDAKEWYLKSKKILPYEQYVISQQQLFTKAQAEKKARIISTTFDDHTAVRYQAYTKEIEIQRAAKKAPIQVLYQKKIATADRVKNFGGFFFSWLLAPIAALIKAKALQEYTASLNIIDLKIPLKTSGEWLDEIKHSQSDLQIREAYTASQTQELAILENTKFHCHKTPQAYERDLQKGFEQSVEYKNAQEKIAVLTKIAQERQKINGEIATSSSAVIEAKYGSPQEISNDWYNVPQAEYASTVRYTPSSA